MTDTSTTTTVLTKTTKNKKCPKLLFFFLSFCFQTAHCACLMTWSTPSQIPGPARRYSHVSEPYLSSAPPLTSVTQHDTFKIAP